MNNEWLNDLKVGDRVVIKNSWAAEIVTVKRITKTLILVPCNDTCDYRFNKSNGRRQGGAGYNCQFLHKLTPEIEAEVRKKKLLNILATTKWNKYNLQQLERIDKVVKDMRI